MPAILDIPEVRERVSRFSVEEYHRLGEFNENGRRTELIRGFIIEKMAKSPLHCTLSALLYKSLLDQIPPGYIVWKERPLTFRDSEPEPDISVTRGRETDFKSHHPSTAELAVEVAVSTPRFDRENASMYAEAGVKEYWIVLAHTQQIEVYRYPEAGRYQEMRSFGLQDTIQCESLPAVRIVLAELFR
jgi:Uma2 family endonuclease